MENNQSTPDHTEDKLDKVRKPGMRLTHHEKAIYDTRVYNDRLYDFAMRILIELKDRHEFNPSLFDKELIGNAFRAAARFLEVGIDHEQSIDIALEWADALEKEDSELEKEQKPEGKWKLNYSNMLYWIETDKGDRVDLKYLAWRNDDTAQYAAQKIADIYNEVLP